MSRFASAVLAGVAALAAAGCVMDEEGGGAAAPGDTAKAPPKEEKKPARPANPWDGTGLTVWETQPEKGKEPQMWVFLDGDKSLDAFLAGKESEKAVTRAGIGPGGKSLRANDAAALDAYQCWKPGFVVRTSKEKDRTFLWVFKEGAKEIAEFDKAGGVLAKHTTRLGAGPGGATLKSPDAETLDAWTAKKHPK